MNKSPPLTIDYAMHQLCAALHMNDIHPEGIEIRLPFDKWERLKRQLIVDNPLTFNYRTYPNKYEFSYMGIVYKPMDDRQ